ncbi:hypothetical protein EVC03_027 [Rhizobium phage RHph_Y5A]|nr:hypothetical protein EVC03_027 [Rhizobium phage RHph_Y5A]QIG75469.1 hypothetical protein EVC18_027 [Rhizobium phage RHph_Y2_4]
MKAMILKYLYPEFDCVDCNGMAWQYGACECSYHHAVAPGVGPSKLIRFLRRVHTFLTSPAWMNEPSVVAEWSRTMRGGPYYYRAWELPDFSADTIDTLKLREYCVKDVMNGAYGRFADQPDYAPVYRDLAAIRDEIKVRRYVSA